MSDYTDEPIDIGDDGSVNREWSREPQDSKAQHKLEQILREVNPGWKVTVMRTAPSWCKGTLEVIEILDPNESIDVQYLIDTWGGEKLHLKVSNEHGKWQGGTTITLASWPPKVHGRELNPPAAIPSVPSIPQQSQGAGGGQNDLVLYLIEQALAKNKGNTDAKDLLRIFEFAQSQVRNAMPVVPQPMEQMLQMFAMFREMKSIFGDLGGGGGSTDENMIPMVADLVKGLLGGRQERPARRALVAPTQPTQPTQPAQPTSQPDTLNGFVDRLSMLSPVDAADVVVGALGNMPENKRNAAIQQFMANLGSVGFEQDDYEEETDLDETLNSADNKLDESSTPSTRGVSGFSHHVKRSR